MTEFDILKQIEHSIGVKLQRFDVIDRFDWTTGYQLNQQNQVIHLDLSLLRLEHFPLEILDLKHLQLLNLGKNRLTEIPPQINKLANLKILILVYNKIKELPEEICDIEFLKEIWLYDNQLSKLPKNFEKLRNLRQLDLTWNNFTEVPEQIKNLTNLHHLDLLNNLLTKLPSWIVEINLPIKMTGGIFDSGIVIGGNEFSYPPMEIIEHGNHSIRKWFDERK